MPGDVLRGILSRFADCSRSLSTACLPGILAIASAACSSPNPPDHPVPSSALPDQCSEEHEIFTPVATPLTIRWESGVSYVVLARGELLDSGEPIGRVESNGRVYGSDGELKFCWTASGALLDAAGEPTGTTLHGNEVRWISDPSPGAIEPVTVSVSADGNRLLVKSSKPAVPSKHGTLESKQRLNDNARRLALLIVLLPDHLAFSDPKGFE